MTTPNVGLPSVVPGSPKIGVFVTLKLCVQLYPHTLDRVEALKERQVQIARRRLTYRVDGTAEVPEVKGAG